MFEQIKNSQRWSWVKAEWAAGNYLKAIVTLFNGMPDLTYPISEEGLPKGEQSYNRMCLRCTDKYGSPNELPCWKNVLWREFWHLTGALIFFIPQISAFLIVYQWNFGAGLGAFLLLWLPMVAFYAHKEFVQDAAGDGKIYVKNYIDLTMWCLPGLSFLLYLIFR